MPLRIVDRDVRKALSKLHGILRFMEHVGSGSLVPALCFPCCIHRGAAFSLCLRGFRSLLLNDCLRRAQSVLRSFCSSCQKKHQSHTPRRTDSDCCSRHPLLPSKLPLPFLPPDVPSSSPLLLLLPSCLTVIFRTPPSSGRILVPV